MAATRTVLGTHRGLCNANGADQTVERKNHNQGRFSLRSLLSPWHVRLGGSAGLGGSADFRAPRTQDLQPREREEEEERGAVFMLVLRFFCCCGRRGARLAPIHVALDEEAEELVEVLQGAMISVAR